jgi:hypothetical protein
VSIARYPVVKLVLGFFQLSLIMEITRIELHDEPPSQHTTTKPTHA